MRVQKLSSRTQLFASITKLLSLTLTGMGIDLEFARMYDHLGDADGEPALWPVKAEDAPQRGCV